MKNFLCALVFALLAAGLFAQGLTLSGRMETGTALFLPDGEEPTISLWSARDGVTARATLIGRAFNKDETAGVNFEMRANAPYSAGDSALYFETARAWIKFLDKRFTLVGGKLDDDGVLRTYGGVDEDTMARGALGLHLRIEAVPNLTLGATVMPGTTGQLNMTNTLEMGNYRFGARYLIPERLGILAMFFDNAQTATYEQSRFHAILGLDILALRGFGFSALRADAGFYDILDEDYRYMKLGQVFAFRKGNMEIGGRFRQSMVLGEKSNTVGYSPELLFRVYGTYALMRGAIRPRLELGYLYGGYRGSPVITSPSMRSDAYETLNSRRSLIDPTQPSEANRLRGFRQNTAYLSIIPQCDFRVQANSSVIIGGGPLFDLTAGEEKYNYMAFVNLYVTF
jgi:hypothetical protein